MYEFIYRFPGPSGQTIQVTSYSEDLNIYEVGELFYRFLLAAGFEKESVRDLFGLEEDEELPIGY